jgi:cardiolipin synthase
MPLLHVPFRGQANLRNHRKIALFDGKTAIVGGMNLADEYMGPSAREDRWRDLALILTGEAAHVLDAVFRADWEFASGVALPPASPTTLRGDGAAPIRVVPSGPDALSDPLYDALLTGIFRAERRFWIATPYFVPDDTLVKALVLAVRRGVDVRVIVPAVSNHLLADLGGAPPLRELRAAGATVRRLDRMLHAKAMLVDDVQAVIGSANFDMRSLFLDYEVALFLSGRREIGELGAWFDEIMQCPAVDGPDSGWIRSRVEGVVRLVAPLL